MSDKPEATSFFDPQHPLAHIGRKIFFALTILVGVIAYYVTRYSKGAQIINNLAHVAPFILLAMLMVEFVYVCVQGNFFQRIYRLLGRERPVHYLMTMYLGMNLVNTIAPVVGLSGSMYMIFFEKRRGISRMDTLLINFLYYITDYLVFLAVLLLGLLYLLINGEITRTIIITSLIFSVFVLVVLIIGVIVFSRPATFQKVAHWLNKWLSKLFFKKEPLFSGQAIERVAVGVEEAWLKTNHARHHLWPASFFALLTHLCCLTLLWLAFQAFQVPVTFQILVAGYTVGTLLNIVSVTPGGIGFAEGGMTAVFAALNVPVDQALVVALLYRTMFIWVPLIFGLGAIQLLPVLANALPADSTTPIDV